MARIGEDSPDNAESGRQSTKASSIQSHITKNKRDEKI